MAAQGTPIVVQVTGFKEFFSTVNGVMRDVLPTAKEVLYAEAQAILRESRTEVPWDTGALAASGRVHEPVIYAKKALVEISYGGASGGQFEGQLVGYAEIQHENTEYRHAEGRKAFYLKDPVDRAREGFAGRVGRRMSALLERRRVASQVEDLNGAS